MLLPFAIEHFLRKIKHYVQHDNFVSKNVNSKFWIDMTAWDKMLTMADPPLWRVQCGGGGARCVILNSESV